MHLLVVGVDEWHMLGWYGFVKLENCDLEWRFRGVIQDVIVGILVLRVCLSALAGSCLSLPLTSGE